MKIFIGQRVTGEDIEKLREECSEIISALEGNGHDAYCTIVEGDDFEKSSAGDKMIHAFKRLDDYDAFLAILRNNSKSEGMLMEIGYSIAKGKKIILLKHKSATDTYLQEVSNEVIEYENIEDLIKRIKEIV